MRSSRERRRSRVTAATRSRRTSRIRSTATRNRASSCSTTCRATTGVRRSSPARSPCMATRRSCPTCTTGTRPVRRRQMRPQPHGTPAVWRTSSSSGTCRARSTLSAPARSPTGRSVSSATAPAVGRASSSPARSTSTRRSTATAAGRRSSSHRTSGARSSGCSARRTRGPSPDDVAALAAALDANEKRYEFHSYPSAGHAFFSVDRPNYRLDAAKEGWKRIWAFLGANLRDT